MKHRDYYVFLGVARSASAEEINKAFREKAMELHPDRNRSNPQAREEFTLLTQVLQTLTDPVRRAKYDSTLPPEEARAKPGQAQGPSGLADLWKSAGRTFFEREERFTPAVDGMRDSVALALEGEDLLIVGINPVNSYLIGYLEASETRNKVRIILTELRGKPTDFRVVSGTSLSDWEAVKVAEDRWREKRKAQDASRMSSASAYVAQAPTPAAPIAPSPAVAQAPIIAPAAGGNTGGSETWDELLESMMRQWNTTENRTYVQIRAKFVLDLLPAVVRVEERARLAGEGDDQCVRNLSRVLERLGNLASVDAGVIGLEYLRFKRMMGGGV